MEKELKIYEEGLEETSLTNIILVNILMILWIALGTIACWYLSPLASWIYLGFAIITVYIVLRKLVCANCYYYDKLCYIGWGKISALFFKKGDIEKFDSNIGIKLAPVTYGLLTLAPLVLIIVSIFQQFSIDKIIVFSLLLLISFYSGGISRRKACENCKMKLICPGCAVKE
ncbi:MAG: hypothetical protein ISS81_08345 [Candidatus Marinimicrobia bacterium]|nr:hypothetical protein [Candidatus Neomarinimicrobiota bacterium]